MVVGQSIVMGQEHDKLFQFLNSIRIRTIFWSISWESLQKGRGKFFKVLKLLESCSNYDHKLTPILCMDHPLPRHRTNSTIQDSLYNRPLFTSFQWMIKKNNIPTLQLPRRKIKLKLYWSGTGWLLVKFSPVLTSEYFHSLKLPQ